MDIQQKWPLILYLHGAGERGHNLDQLKTVGLPKKLEGQTDFPFIVLSPQGNGEHEFWAKDEMVQSLLMLLDEVQGLYSINNKRIYLSGVSAGGNGTWEIGLRYHDRFAALVPVAGYYAFPFAVPSNICDLKETPVWAFHGAKDELVPLSAEQQLVDALRACGGNVQFTVYPDVGHDIANDTYTNSDLYTWMLSQTLK
jgi:predicted peptidase